MKSVHISRAPYHSTIALIKILDGDRVCITRMVPVDGPCPPTDVVSSLVFSNVSELRKDIRVRMAAMYEASKVGRA